MNIDNMNVFEADYLAAEFDYEVICNDGHSYLRLAGDFDIDD